jgi:endonuclease YncB( thermonuclease family)
MKQGRKLVALVATLAVLAAPLPALAAAKARAPKNPGSTTTAAPKSRRSLHQFTGVVTALDGTSLTVEKRGKNPRSMVFVRDAEMSTRGAVDRDATVTVYYRDEGGRSIAQRVVAKVPTPAPEKSAGSGR